MTATRTCPGARLNIFSTEPRSWTSGKMRYGATRPVRTISGSYALTSFGRHKNAKHKFLATRQPTNFCNIYLTMPAIDIADMLARSMERGPERLDSLRDAGVASIGTRLRTAFSKR